jgi:membrane-associated protein
MENVIQQIIALTSTLDLRLAAVLIPVCAIGEFGIISIPYLLESVWLMAGYHLGTGALSPLHLFGLWLAAQLGRQAGAMALYRLGRFGATPLTRFYQKLHLERFSSRLTSRSASLSRIDLSSPFSIAYGRLFGMRIPMTLILAVKGKPLMLSLGVLLSSIVWDAVYISVGVIFGSATGIKPAYMFLISLGGLTVIYLMTAIIPLLARRRQAGNLPVE